MPDPDAEFLRMLQAAFAEEAREHIEALSACLLQMEAAGSSTPAPPLVERIFREAHSLKGAARSVDRTDIESICQALESVFSRWKAPGAAQPSRAVFDALNSAVTFLEKLLSHPEPSSRSHAPETHRLLVALRELADSGSPPSSAATITTTRPGGFPPDTATPRETPAPPSQPAPPLPVQAASPLPAQRVEEQPAPSPRRLEPAGSTLRVPAVRMDALMQQLEEIVSVKNAATERQREIQELRRTLRGWRAEASLLTLAQPDDTAPRKAAPRQLDWMRGCLEACEGRLFRIQEALEQDRRALGGMVDGLLRDARQLAMLPLSTLLDPLPRQVRELARSQGKSAELTLEGTAIELDKRILEQLKDPLLHLVRNCVDHGVEIPAARRAAGKRETGQISIHVTHLSAAQVEIVLRDDGAGIDATRVKAAAVANGLLREPDAAALSRPEALRLIFRSGVSTRASVTELSGRGLGMAIVSEAVEELGGSVDVESTPGQGTVFRILLPVNLARFSGVLVQCGTETVIAPMGNIIRAFRVPRGDARSDDVRETLPLDGRNIPLVHLRGLLGVETHPGRLPGEMREVLLLASGHTQVAFTVDAVGEQMELLVRPFRAPLLHPRHFAAASILPSGRAVLILNVPELIESALALATRAPEALQPSFALEKQARDILVADDSVTSRMLLKNILEAAGYRVQTASDGVDALTALRTQRFDLVVSDVQMPRMDGFDLVARVRGDPRLDGIPVVLVTALDSPADRERGLGAGAAAYVVKGSFSQSNLLEVVGELL